MKQGKLYFLIFLSLVGLGVSFYLTSMHFTILKEGLKGPSFCTINEHIDCDVVITSRFSKIGPFSLGGLGFIYYLYLLLPLLYARISPESLRSTLILPLFSLTLASLGMIPLALISSLVLKTYCLLCISLYLITWGSFLLMKSLLQIRFSDLGGLFVNYVKALFGKAGKLSFPPHFFGNILYLFLVFGIGLFMLYSTENKYAKDYEDFDRKAFLDFHYLQKPISFEIEGRPFLGSANAPVKIIEFSDFECPYCQVAALNFKPRLKQYQDKVQFVFYHLPLDKACNPYMKRDLHEQACNAAGASICANEQQKFWPYHDLLFQNQAKFSDEQLKDYAKKTGLDLPKFESCLRSEATKSKILKDIEASKNAGVQGTPTIFINGRPFKDWMNPVMLNVLIEEEIKRARK